MPRVTVVLDGGSEVKVEGANSAEWTSTTLLPGNQSPLARSTFVVYFKTENETKVLARFDSSKVVGYVFDPID